MPEHSLKLQIENDRRLIEALSPKERAVLDREIGWSATSCRGYRFDPPKAHPNRS